MSLSLRKPKRQTFSRLVVRAIVGQRSKGLILGAGLPLVCDLGRGGIGTYKIEGDGKTPRAVLPIRRLHYRADEHLRPRTALPVRRIRQEDGWCDAPQSSAYNRLIRLPFNLSHEEMWRSDHLYDFVLELGWNDRPVLRGKGSAIFFHLSREDRKPTAGCIALPKQPFKKLLSRLGSKTKIQVI